jgi:hypothetical protein
VLRRTTVISLLIAFVPSLLVAQGTPAAAKARAPRYILVVDAETEEPIEGAQVRDVLTGNAMRTSRGGAVGLFVPQFVRKDGALIEVRMPGYQPSERLYVDPTLDTAVVIGLRKVGSTSADGQRPRARQLTDSTVFQFMVLDEQAEPLPEATISIVQGVSNVLASRVTDETGMRTLAIKQSSGEVQITVQRVGYTQAKQFYRLGSADTVVAQVAMRRLAQQLDPVNVRAKRDLKREIYYLNSSVIDSSKRNLKDGLDVVRWLRPEMFGYRTRGVDGYTPGACGVANVIWVNGRRIVFAPQGITLEKLWRPSRPASVNTRGPGGRPSVRRSMPPSGEAAASDMVRAVLSSIRPEHIAEMTYTECFDTTFRKLHTNNAIFVVLKSGVVYDDNRGSIVEPDTTRSR